MIVIIVVSIWIIEDIYIYISTYYHILYTIIAVSVNVHVICLLLASLQYSTLCETSSPSLGEDGHAELQKLIGKLLLRLSEV